MSFGSWLKNLFHKVNAQHIAGALAAAQKIIDETGAIEKWTWLPKFDSYVSQAVPLLDSWKSGSPTTEIIQLLNDALGVVNGVTGLSANDKLLIDLFVSTAESGLELIS